MKKRKILLLIVSIVILCAAAVLVGCSKTKGNFSVKGEAVVNIVFDKAYENVSVSCPEAVITKADDKNFRLDFKNRNQIEVVVSCPTFITQYLKFTTKQLAEEITQNVTMAKKEFVHEFVVGGVAELVNVKIADKSIGAVEGNIISTEVVNNSIFVKSKNPLSLVEVSAANFKSVELHMGATVNYYVKQPVELISNSDNSKVVLYFDNDKEFKELAVRDTLYGDYLFGKTLYTRDDYSGAEESILNACVVIEKGKDLLLKGNNSNYSDNNFANGEYLLTKTQLENSDYLFLKASDFVNPNDTTVIQLSFDVYKFSGFLESYQMYRTGNFIINNEIYDNSRSYDSTNNEEKTVSYGFAKGLKAGDEIYHNRYENGQIKNRMYVLKEQDIATKTINYDDFDVNENVPDDNAIMLKFVDDDENIILSDIVLSLSNDNSIPNKTVNSGTITLKKSETGQGKLQVIKNNGYIINGNNVIDFGELVGCNSIIISFNKLSTVKLKIMAGAVPVKTLENTYDDVTLNKTADQYGYFEFFEKCDLDSLVSFVKNNSGKFKAIDGFRTDGLSISFNKKLAKLVDGVYYMEVTLQSEKNISVTIDNFDSEIAPHLSIFDRNPAINLTINNRFLNFNVEGYDYDNPLVKNFNLLINEGMIGKTITFSASAQNGEMQVSIRGSLSITQALFNSGDVHLNLKVNVYNFNVNK